MKQTFQQPAKPDGREDQRIFLLREERPDRAVVKLSVPLIAGMFIMVMYNLVDTFFIGLLRDDYQLAAVSLAYPVMMIMVSVSNMVSSGSASLIARSLGAKEKKKAETTLLTAILMTVLNSAIVTVLGLLFLPAITRGLGAGEMTFDYTRQYIGVLLAGSVFTMGSYTGASLLRSEGSVRMSIAGMIAGTIVNIVLDPLFIFTFGLQVRGAAIATVLGNAAGTLVTLWFYLRGKTLLSLRTENFRIEVPVVLEICRVGIPASLETLLTSAAYIVNNRLAVSYGELTVAAMGIAQKIMQLGNYIYQGFAAGTQPIMGYNYGAGNYRRMTEVLKAGILITSGTELAVMCVCGLFAPQLIAVFTENPEVIETGTVILRAVMWILPFVGAVSMCRMSFQAMGKPMHAFLITLVRQLFLYVPLLLLLNQTFGFQGMIHAQPITEAIMMAVSTALLLRVIRTEAAKSS